MSEIKGQLLGIVLVVAVFGVVGTLLVTAFQKSATNISKKIETDTEPTPSTSYFEPALNSNDLLVF